MKGKSFLSPSPPPPTSATEFGALDMEQFLIVPKRCRGTTGNEKGVSDPTQ